MPGLLPYTPLVLSLLRIITGALLLNHGTGKILNIPENDHRPTPLGLYWFVGLAELVLGALLVVGLFTVSAAFIASGLCAFAYFIGHAPKSFYPYLNGGEGAIMFCFIFLFVFFAGPGPISMDALLGLFGTAPAQ